jgi:hypothetical protein
MKRIATFALVAIACIGLGWAAFQAAAPTEPLLPLSGYFPADGLLYIEAKDFSSLLATWNKSPERLHWIASSNYEVFSRSRLFLRLKGAGDQFAVAAGLPPDMNFLTSVAGSQSALAIYDIGKLQFLYITRLPSARSLQTAVWQKRSTFESRSAGGAEFYIRRDPASGKEVAFAVRGDYMLLATREDLLAGALQLMAGSKDRTIAEEPWWSQSVAAAKTPGDLRLVLNLEKIVPGPYFRSYWIQQNITDMKQYNAAISDLVLSGGSDSAQNNNNNNEDREERVLLRRTAPADSATVPDGAHAVAELMRLVPESAGVYKVQADPTDNVCLDLLTSKILAPHLGPAPAEQVAPHLELTSGETGSAADLETRIDQAPAEHEVGADAFAGIKSLLHGNRVRASLQVRSTGPDNDGVFIRMHSAIVLVGTTDWDQPKILDALVDAIRPGLTASRLGVGWQQKSGYQELDGLQSLITAVRGNYLLVSDDPALMTTMLANFSRKPLAEPAVFLAGFDHARERGNFTHFTTAVDRPNMSPVGAARSGREPQFFAENMVSLSSALGRMDSEDVVVRDRGDKVLQTVRYKWSH